MFSTSHILIFSTSQHSKSQTMTKWKQRILRRVSRSVWSLVDDCLLCFGKCIRQLTPWFEFSSDDVQYRGIAYTKCCEYRACVEKRTVLIQDVWLAKINGQDCLFRSHCFHNVLN